MEVLLVLAILVILGSSVGYFLLGAQERAYIRSSKIQMSNFDIMLLGYKLEVGSYPSTEQGLQALHEQPAGATKWAKQAAKPIPEDPWGHPYQYELVDNDNFVISSWGPDGQGGTEDDVTHT